MAKCIKCLHYNVVDDRCNVVNNGVRNVMGKKDCGNFVELVVGHKPPQIRQFDSGATRDTNVGKLDYEGFLSPIVLKRYCQYLHKHRVQSDENLRDSDNWQGMFGEKHFDICMKSAWRHFMDWWLEHRGHNISKNGIEDAMCGLLFNIQAYLFKTLKDKEKNNETD